MPIRYLYKKKRKKKLPMNDFTQEENEVSRIVEMKNVAERPSDATVCLLRMFARYYEPSMMVAV